MSEPIPPVETPAAADDQSAEQTVTFKGQTFKLNPDVSEWAFMEFAEAADSGVEAGSMAGIAAMLRFVVELIHPDDRDRFRVLCRRERVGSDDLVELMLGKTGDDAERPTVRSSDSSDGPTTTGPKSASSSAASGSPTRGLSLVQVARARPDLAVFLDQATPHAS